MHREAAFPSRAVLLATHQPPQIRQVLVSDAGRYGNESRVSQEDLLATIARADDEALIVPIIGAAGSGKSHLVLWLRARLDDEQVENRRIIYLAKDETRLDRVIDKILDGRTGSPFDELRDAVATATRELSPEEAARSLRNELSAALRRADVGTDPQVQEYKELVRTTVPDLLDDPVYVTRLVADDGAFRRIVDQAATGGNDRPAEISADDLEIQLTAADFEKLSYPAKTCLGYLRSSEEMLSVAVAMLNDLLPPSLMRVFGVQPMQLVGVMSELRQRLFEENSNLELVLMIEDFTLLQGIQHDLLEAMIALPRREGKQVMCAMKTVMAVTDGFFTRVLASSDTLRTRIAAQGHVYNLDVEYASEADVSLDRDAIVGFAGRYLNAVRVGADMIEESEPDVPNACEICAHRDVCHAAFETSDRAEYGLYPFNPVALDRMVRSRQDKFNPRDLLAVMASTLTEHAQEMSDGRFPSAAWARRFDASQFDRPSAATLSLKVQSQVEQTPKHEQRSVLLTFWGNVPDDLVNLPAGIHEAFDVPQVTGVIAVVPQAAPVADVVRAAVPASDQIGNTVQAWRDGGRLDAEAARIIRRTFRDAILEAVDPESELLSGQLLDEAFPSDIYIVIAESAGSGRPAPGPFRVAFPQINESAVLFQGILQMQQRGTWDIQDGQQILVAFLNRVQAEAKRLRVFVDELLAARRADHRAAVQVLVLAGLIAGRGSTADNRTLLAAAMGTDTAPSREGQPPRWAALQQSTADYCPPVRAYALQGAHVSKSTSDPSGVDGQQFVPALQSLAEGWAIPEFSEAAPRQARNLQELLASRLQPALDEAFETLSEWQSEVTRLVGDPDTALDRHKRWRATLDTAKDNGFLVSAGGYSEDATPGRLAELMRLVQAVLEQWSEWPLGRRVTAVAGLPWQRLGPTKDYLIALEATLNESLKKAHSQHPEGDSGSSPIAEFEKALDRLEQAARLGEVSG